MSTEQEDRITSLTENYSKEELLKLSLEMTTAISKERWEISNSLAKLEEKSKFLYMIIRALANK